MRVAPKGVSCFAPAQPDPQPIEHDDDDQAHGEAGNTAALESVLNEAQLTRHAGRSLADRRGEVFYRAGKLTYLFKVVGRLVRFLVQPVAYPLLVA